MACSACGNPHYATQLCSRLQQVALFLNLFTAPAFLTDPLNRFVSVNQTFARMIGDPIQDRLPPKLRFIDAAIIGPYRERFPHGKLEVAQCSSNLKREVEAGRLAPGVLKLLDITLALDEDLSKIAQGSKTPWDGTVVVKDPNGKLSLISERVVSVADSHGRASGFHVSWWLPAEQDPPEPLAGLSSDPAGPASLLTPRQLEIARWYAAGLTSRAVAEQAV